jgi:hypothetical protein
MRKLITRKRAIALGAVGALALVAVAVAYFTSTGSGSGSAAVGTSSTLKITAEVPTTLYPGTSSKVKFSVENPSEGHQFINTISLTNVEAFKDAGHTEAIAACQSSWFTMTPVEVKTDLTGKSTQTLGTEGTLKFENKNESQDACKNAFLVAKFTSN